MRNIFLFLLLSAFQICAVAVENEPMQKQNSQNTNLEKMRLDFIENFKRSGLNTTPGDATFLRIMIESTNAKRGVEVGSANGYGAMNMGIGFEKTGGHLYTIDIDPNMVKECRENIGKIKLEKSVTCFEGDALKVLPTLEGEFDFVFIDAAKHEYLGYFKALEPKLKSGALIVADNVIQFASSMQDFLNALEKNPDYEMVTIRASMEKNDGMAVIYKRR